MEYIDNILNSQINIRTQVSNYNSNLWVARLILNQGNYSFSPSVAAHIISNVVSHWPNGCRVDTFLTFGGFIQFNWPSNITNIGDPINPNAGALNLLFRYIDSLIYNNFIELLISQNLVNYFDYLTVGIDGYDTNSSLHIELVYLIETTTMRIVNRTGKSYPLCNQQNGLIRITNFNSHFYQTKMILGCHDLKIFDNRSYSLAQGWKLQTINCIRTLFNNNSNIILVLHHPHFIDTYRTFWNAIVNLKKIRSGVSFASSFRYYNMTNLSSRCRQTLQQVLNKTIYNVNCINFLFSI